MTYILLLHESTSSVSSTSVVWRSRGQWSNSCVCRISLPTLTHNTNWGYRALFLANQTETLVTQERYTPSSTVHRHSYSASVRRRLTLAGVRPSSGVGCSPISFPSSTTGCACPLLGSSCEVVWFHVKKNNLISFSQGPVAHGGERGFATNEMSHRGLIPSHSASANFGLIFDHFAAVLWCTVCWDVSTTVLHLRNQRTAADHVKVTARATGVQFPQPTFFSAPSFS